MSTEEQLRQELAEIEQELATLNPGSRAYQALLGQKAALEAQLTGSGAIAQGEGATALGQDAIGVQGDLNGNLLKGDANQVIQNSTVIVAGDGARIVIGEQPVELSAKLRETALGRYLEHVIAHNRYLQLQGIRSGGKLVNIELEQIYITLRTTQQRTSQAEDEWLRQEADFAPGELRKGLGERLTTETVNVKVEQALAAHRRLVVLGDPGSGKTTLLRYLALLYGRDLAQGLKIVRDKLQLAESGCLPVLLPLRQIGQFLKAHRPKDDGTEGCALLLDFLFQSLKNQKLDLPGSFFDEYLEIGRAVVLLDGMDEVADPELRARVARLVEAFSLAYPKCRLVVTSRIVGYSGPARLGADYVTTTVRDFTLEDVRQFLTHWHRLVAIGQLGAGESAENFAASQTAQLLSAIQANERVRELAINPLMLTVIALVHRDRVKLPDRRAELYAEAVEVLLGKWDEARGVQETVILENRPFDAGDKKLLLQSVALFMHEHQQKDISLEDLRRLIEAELGGGLDQAQKRKAVERFQQVIEERTGLLVARAEGIYAFSHLTFQEYLTAIAVALREDYITRTLAHSDEAWWREVILLEAGFLSVLNKERTSKLIRAIAENKKEPTPYHNLVLALECIRDVGAGRLEGDLDTQIEQQLKQKMNQQLPVTARWLGRLGLRGWVERRAEVVQALARAGSGYWTMPHGEPEWGTIPAGEFWMGGAGPSDGKPVHKLYLPEYQIARVPVTNAQYALFVKAANYTAPDGWDENRPPKGRESHPVVNVTWFDALAYCAWLSKMTGKQICLPSEAEWEKAARGDKDQRAWPWGNEFDSSKCNSSELGLDDTTPVGIFLEGASPDGVLDLSGNVLEWTRSLYHYPYPYQPEDGREKLFTESEYKKAQGEDSNGRKIVYVLRGGSFNNDADDARCAFRHWDFPSNWSQVIGFRVVVVFSRASR